MGPSTQVENGPETFRLPTLALRHYRALSQEHFLMDTLQTSCEAHQLLGRSPPQQKHGLQPPRSARRWGSTDCCAWRLETLEAAGWARFWHAFKRSLGPASGENIASPGCSGPAMPTLLPPAFSREPHSGRLLLLDSFYTLSRLGGRFQRFSLNFRSPSAWRFTLHHQDPGSLRHHPAPVGPGARSI